MKTFLNVLYRRILYKIPLKLLLFLLVIFGVLFVCFSKAGYEGIGAGNIGLSASQTLQNFLSSDTNTYGKDTFCMMNNGTTTCNVTATNPLNNDSATINGIRKVACLTGLTIGSSNGLTIKNNANSSCSPWFLVFNQKSLFEEQYTSLQCQTVYNLIPIESVDSNYCQTNNLCPSCPVCPSVPVGTGGYSQLYINNILHLGAPNIIMNIPDEIDWDYAYTQGGQNMNIDVVGYNVDYEKIDSIVQFQNYKPSSDDFQKIIGLLAPYTKIIVFFVFLFIVWAWIKKPFKSKKL